MAEVTYINATFKCCGFSEKQLCNAGRILTESSTAQASPLLSLIRFLLRNDTHMLSLCESSAALVAYNPGPTSHSKVISRLETLLSAITLLSSARFVTSQPCNAIVLAEHKMETLFGCQIRTLWLEKYPMQRVLLSKTYIFKQRES